MTLSMASSEISVEKILTSPEYPRRASGRSFSSSMSRSPGRGRATAPAPRRRLLSVAICRPRRRCSIWAAASAGRHSISPSSHQGSIVAVDSHAPSIERLRATVAVRGLAGGFGLWSATWPNPGCRRELRPRLVRGGALQHRHRERPADLPRAAARRRLSRLHRRGLAQGEPAARGQSELRSRLSDHGPGSGRPGCNREMRLLAHRALHPAGRGVVG
jgi:hypothetical protein